MYQKGLSMALHAQLHILAATACVLATGCAAYPTLQERTALLAPAVQYYAPETAVPAPLVILVSGCGGLTGLQGPKQVMKTYAEAATSAGAYVAVMDSFAPRGISFEESVRTVCSGLRLHGNERAGDIIAAEALARSHWKVDFTGVILAGWSHGGWTVMELLSAGADARDVGGFRIDRAAKALTPDAVALYYPYCGLLNATGRSRWDFKGPLLLLITDAEKACVEQVEDARAGAAIDTAHFAANTHAFDEEDQVPGSEFKYDPAAAARAKELFHRFVKDQVERLDRAPT